MAHLLRKKDTKLWSWSFEGEKIGHFPVAFCLSTKTSFRVNYEKKFQLHIYFHAIPRFQMKTFARLLSLRQTAKRNSEIAYLNKPKLKTFIFTKFLTIFSLRPRPHVVFSDRFLPIRNADGVSRGEGGEGTPKKLGRGVRPASQSPYPIYD